MPHALACRCCGQPVRSQPQAVPPRWAQVCCTAQAAGRAESDADSDADDEGGEQGRVSKKKRKLDNRLKIAVLKQLCPRPEVVEVWDVTAPDPQLLVYLKVLPTPWFQECCSPLSWPVWFVVLGGVWRRHHAQLQGCRSPRVLTVPQQVVLACHEHDPRSLLVVLAVNSY